MNNKGGYLVNGNIAKFIEAGNVYEKLPLGLWIPQPSMTGPYLELFQDKYVFDYKVYGLKNDFIDRAMKTYTNTKGNLGILLNGIKGTGKSVTAKILCNKFMEELKMPVVLVSPSFTNIGSVVNDIKEDAVIFIDEYEKLYNNAELKTALLSFMDGSFSSEYRRVFIFTTNSLNVDTNLLERPGRIRYCVRFENLTRDQVKEIVEDTLIHPELRESCIQTIARLKTITVDTVKSLIQEVNIHKQSPKEFLSIFNVEEKQFRIEIYKGDAKETDFPVSIVNSQDNIFEYIVSEECNGLITDEELIQDCIDEDVYFSIPGEGTYRGELKAIKDNKFFVEDDDGVVKDYKVNICRTYNTSYIF